ncbi:MAG: PfkB family carbohydrate kinase [Candidatus Njordarchaeia archaeon]
MFELVAIGNPVFDVIETPFVRSDGRVLSGCSTNAALAFSKLGGRAFLVGKVGSDFRDVLVSWAARYGVEALPLESQETGGFHLVYKDEAMRDRDLFVLGVADAINFDELPDFLFEKDSFLLGPILQEINSDFIMRLREHIGDKVVLLDPQGTIREFKDGKVFRVRKDWVIEIIKHIQVVKPNEHEAEIIFPGLELWKIARKIAKLNGHIGVVTLADRGSYVSFDGKTYHIPAYRTVERDPTGCGDVYGGAFLFKYLGTGDPVESGVFASAAASFMVETIGPDFEMNIKKVYERFEALVENVKRID